VFCSYDDLVAWVAGEEEGGGQAGDSCAVRVLGLFDEKEDGD
jgi:hypothetical protein